MGEFAIGKLHEVNEIEGVPIKIEMSYNTSDNSFPVVAVLTREGNGYLASTNTEISSDSLNEIMNFTKIETKEKINDIIFLQNYEVIKPEEHIMMTGSAIPFVKFGREKYHWYEIKKEEQNGNITLTVGKSLSDLQNH